MTNDQAREIAERLYNALALIEAEAAQQGMLYQDCVAEKYYWITRVAELIQREVNNEVPS